MVIFSESMAKLVAELGDKGIPVKTTVTEESIVIELGATSAEKPVEKKGKHKLFTFNRVSKTLPEWAEEYGVPVYTMNQRFVRNGSPETRLRRGKEGKTSKK